MAKRQTATKLAPNQTELPSLEEVIADLKRRPTVPVWPHVGLLLDLPRNGAYAAVDRGEVEVIKVGRLKKAISAPLRRRLGLEAA